MSFSSSLSKFTNIGNADGLLGFWKKSIQQTEFTFLLPGLTQPPYSSNSALPQLCIYYQRLLSLITIQKTSPLSLTHFYKLRSSTPCLALHSMSSNLPDYSWCKTYYIPLNLCWFSFSETWHYCSISKAYSVSQPWNVISKNFYSFLKEEFFSPLRSPSTNESGLSCESRKRP